MAITVADVLQMPAVRGADPEVLGGAAGLTRPVRWVHTTELPDIAELLRDGDLVLTTGIALPEAVAELASFATSLAEYGAAGLFIELGRRWQRIPAPLVEACEHAGLPLVALRREVRFASVAQSVGERIVDQQLTELREAHQVHDTFTTLSVAEAGPGEILAAVSSLAAATAVLESEDRRVLDFVAGPRDAAAFLEDWQRRSLAVRPRSRTEWDASSGWLVARIGKPERGWGRLVIDCPTPPTQRLVAVAERGAAALAMHMLHDRQRVDRDRQLHHELLVTLLADPSAPDVERRCGLAGLPTAGRSFVALALRATGRPTGTEELVAALVHATATRRTPALIAAVGGTVQVLLSLPRRAAGRTVDDLVATIPPRVGFVAAAGTAVTEFAAVDRTMREAHQVMAALTEGAAERRVHHLEDVHVRGLLTLLADDERLSTFSDRELHALRASDHEGRLEAALRAMLRHPTSKSAAAASLAVSRPVLYERLARAGAVLGLDLDDGEVRTSLHVALLAADLRAAQASAPVGSLTGGS
ncbi:PucR family transcriptional regulator ligand-binding domain-containing protein [Nocardioides sp. BP30]|uniref:PucR family transcriptional regulator n=1 Tax=Nocardioides sp. BP30 TaxID=3036374 RepID=UPI002468B08B|nr:PucR family transcriptional regulator ligand-binding domain-containing protein [Nocardioides sp. BP30]WGL53525.1 PucR family transcriptional regulator ligand-binding domain-containing protein [Nocardioides sp. BP30]